MAKAKHMTCDRCKEAYPHNQFAELSIRDGVSGRTILSRDAERDLCPPCTRAVCLWLKSNESPTTVSDQLIVVSAERLRWTPQLLRERIRLADRGRKSAVVAIVPGLGVGLLVASNDQSLVIACGWSLVSWGFFWIIAALFYRACSM